VGCYRAVKNPFELRLGNPGAGISYCYVDFGSASHKHNVHLAVFGGVPDSVVNHVVQQDFKTGGFCMHVIEVMYRRSIVALQSEIDFPGLGEDRSICNCTLGQPPQADHFQLLSAGRIFASKSQELLHQVALQLRKEPFATMAITKASTRYSPM
jgi:hypothetical protein